MGSNLSKVKATDSQNKENNVNKQSTDWITYCFATQIEALNLLSDPVPTNNKANAENVLKIKLVIDENFDELSVTNLGKLQQKFDDQSFVISIAANNDKTFHIYWKSKDIQQVLSLKPYKESFSETDKHLCEFIAEFLVNSLQDGHLGIHPNLDIQSSNSKIELHSLVDHRNYNLLLLTSEAGNAKPIEALLKYGIESQLPESEVTAQSLAWQGHHSEVLLKLLQANLPFPPQIDVNECSEELKKFIETSEEFHNMIEDKNEDRLREIIKQNPNLRYFYNLSNKSALKAALDQKHIDMYEFLISKNLSFAPHEDTDDIWEDFNRSEKIKLRNINLKYAKGMPEKHINVLMFNTSFSHDEEDEEGKRKLVLRAYRALNSYPRLKIILKIVAATKIFHVFFDFHRDSTYRIDPTTSRYTQGIFYFSGRIIVGAKQLNDPDREHETFGVLIHELCHYACLAVYENQSDPYTVNDQEAREEFARIMEICKERMEEEPVIQSVFDCYPEEHQPSELIVRPPHLIALYSHQPEVLQEVSATFNELFDHYINVVVPAMERALPEIEVRLAYRPAQKYGMLSDQKKEQVQNAVVKYKNVEVKLSELFPGNSDIFEKLTSGHISQLLSDKELNFDDPQLRYLEEQIEFKWESLAEDLREKFLNSNLNFQGEIVKFKDLHESCPDAFNALTSQQIINVLNGNEFVIGTKVEMESKFYVERKFIPEYVKLIFYEYTYGHEYVFDEETEYEHVRNRKKDKSFQQFYNEFLMLDFENFSKTLEKVKDNLDAKSWVYNLNNEIFQFMYKNSKEIVDQAEKEKILILSSEAGAGKTDTFKRLTVEMKEKFPTRWVSYIDLQKYTKFYKTKGTAENVGKLFEEILNLSPEKNKFEVRIFEECFKSGTAVLVWNGFDEISPLYNEHILNILKSVHENTLNIQLVCTRPLYSKQLSKLFRIRTWELLTFDENKKQEFLREYFIFENVCSKDIEQKIKKVEEVTESFKVYEPIRYNFKTPLMLKLVAEIHDNEDLFKFAHIYGIFETFVERKIEIWLERNKISISIAKKLLFSGSLKIVLQKFALLNKFQVFSTSTLALKMRKLQIMQKQIPQDMPIEEISRMGILFINGKNEFEFSHRTFAEFFVAQYFIENIFNVDGSVDSDEAELRLELFFHLTHQYGETQQIITNFMTSFLQMRNKMEDKKFNLTISKLLRTKFRNFFIRTLDTNHPKVFEFLFEFFKPEHDLLVDLLHVYEDETLYTAIFNPNHFELLTNPKDIKSLAQNCLTDEEFRQFLKGKNQKGKILYGIHFYRLLGVPKSSDAHDTLANKLKSTSFWEFFGKMKSILTKDEQKELFVTALSPKIYLFYDKMFSTSDFSEYEKLWTNFESLLTQNEMQDALGNALVLYFEICPYDKAGQENFLFLLLNKVKKFLSKSKIHEMFLTKNILNEAHWDPKSFQILWKFLCKHTNENKRRKILLQDDFDDKNFYFYTSNNEMKKTFSGFEYQYFYYDFTPFKIFHRALTMLFAASFNLTKEIYENHFKKSEIQEIISSSNDFLYYVIGRTDEIHCQQFISYLEELFRENEKLLKKFLERKIEPTNLTLFEFVEDFRGLPHSQLNWFSNLKMLTDLHNKIKNT